MSRKTISAAVLFALFAASPAFALDLNVGARAKAQTGATTTVSAGAKVEAKEQERMEKGKDHADQEIERRVDALASLKSRVDAMVRLTDENKTSIKSSIDSQIGVLSSLKAKIEADTDLSVLKADVKSITNSYRIFLLVIPQGHIAVTADKIAFAAGNLKTFAAKISSRIDAAATAGTDVTALKAKFAAMQDSIVSAQDNASAAVSLSAGLKPDEGDKTREDANAQALKDARAKLKVGLQAIVDARKAAHDIVESLAKIKVQGSASGSVQ